MPVRKKNKAKSVHVVASAGLLGGPVAVGAGPGGGVDQLLGRCVVPTGASRLPPSVLSAADACGIHHSEYRNNDENKNIIIVVSSTNRDERCHERSRIYVCKRR